MTKQSHPRPCASVSNSYGLNFMVHELSSKPMSDTCIDEKSDCYMPLSLSDMTTLDDLQWLILQEQGQGIQLTIKLNILTS